MIFQRVTILALISVVATSQAFTFTQPNTSLAIPTSTTSSASKTTALNVEKNTAGENSWKNLNLVSSVLSTAVAVTLGLAGVCWADEVGVSIDAPTLFTGEVVDICVKRGPLGKCEKAVKRTIENDNDKALTYMKAESDSVKMKDAEMRSSDDSDSSPLVQKLRQQTADNKERNDRLVLQKTIENDLSASFGPFDRQVVILNTDERTYTLLQNPQAMRLKKAGFIEGKRFVKQPTEEDIEEALTPSEEEENSLLGSILKGISGDQ